MTRPPWIVLGILCAVIFLGGLGRIGLLDPDEPRYAQGAREMIERGDYVTPYFNGEPRLNKPPLAYWLMALSYRLFGVHEWSARLVPALAAIASVWLVAWWAARQGSAFVGLAAGLMLATSLEFIVLGRLANTDMLLAWWMTLALVAWFERWYFLWWIALALGMLTKGPVAVVVPGLVIGGYLVWSREWARLKEMRWIPGLLVFCVISAPWYLALGMRHGWVVLHEFFVRENVSRFVADPYERAQPWWYLLPVFVGGAFPWSMLWPEAVWSLKREGRVPPIERFAIVWALAVLAFFSLSTSKLYSYLAPVFPAMAVLTACRLERFRAGRQPLWVAGVVGCVVLGVGAAALSRYVHERLGAPAAAAFVPVVSILVLTGLAAFLAWGRGRIERGVQLATACVALTHLAVIFAFSPHLEAHRSLRPLVTQLDPALREQARVVSFAITKPGATFYFNRRVERLDDETALRRIQATRDEPVLCLMTRDTYETLAPDVKARWALVATSARLVLAQAR